MFFDSYPRFLETSGTGARPDATTAESKRLSIRQEAMIAGHEQILRGKRVLDIASHDGRWSFAALKAGAAHVTGVEARPELVKHAEENLAHYGVDRGAYRFVDADVFDVLADPDSHAIEVDVVMCLGFVYHTLRYPELFTGIRSFDAEHLLIDTAVHPSKEKVVRVFGEDVTKETAGADNPYAHAQRMLTGRPSVSALEMILEVYGFDIVERVDWPKFLRQHHPDVKSVQQYRQGRRVTWLCRQR
ncbi:MAG: methyltransferase domain-containing protein [Actinomycetota bacterium]|nr:methyltransferase domain-containing protein [Actinomycetota bacterium]